MKDRKDRRNKVTKMTVSIFCGYCKTESDNIEVASGDVIVTGDGDISFDIRCPKCNTFLWIIGY